MAFRKQQQVVVGKSSGGATVTLPPSVAPLLGLLLLSSPANVAFYPTMMPGRLEKPNCGYWDDNWD
ncbi:Hypothetical predicted protein, partial [Podarcis lilfordi]